MKCVVCSDAAFIDVRRANSNFCVEHFNAFCHRQVERAINDFAMFTKADRLLVAVSGGKDSLALWDILMQLGYNVEGLYIALGIGEYSKNSEEMTRQFAAKRGFPLHVVDLNETYEYDIPNGSRTARRSPCSACGISKRHVFDRVARDHGFDVLLTGHNLDDEAAVLFGNVLRWNVDYMARQMPVLPPGDGFPKKAKPLVRLAERDTAAYCISNGIDYVVEECPMAGGNRHIGYKEALNEIELASPGSKTAFYFEFLAKAQQLLSDGIQKAAGDSQVLGRCTVCGSPAGSEICAFCRLVDRAGGVPLEEGEVVGLTLRNQRGETLSVSPSADG